MTQAEHPQTVEGRPTCECGHDPGMHRRGSSPAYAGCMVVVSPKTAHRRMRHCPCSLTPEEATR